MPKSAKGSRRERELLDFLTKKGFVVHRVAGSGLGEDAICDLVAVKNGEVQFVECKSRKKVYYTKINSEQLRELIKIANSCKAKPVLAVKINYKEWQIFDLNENMPMKVE
jgi:Holliday junction resolvase